LAFIVGSVWRLTTIGDKHMNALFDQETKLFFADLSLWRQNGDSDTLKA